MSNKVPWIAENCGRCGRPLKTDKSREQGYGPRCLEKIEEERFKNQMQIDEILERGCNCHLGFAPCSYCEMSFDEWEK